MKYGRSHRNVPPEKSTYQARPKTAYAVGIKYDLWKPSDPKIKAVAGISIPKNPKTGISDNWKANKPRGAKIPTRMASLGLSSLASTGSKIIPAVMKPAPPMKALIGIALDAT